MKILAQRYNSKKSILHIRTACFTRTRVHIRTSQTQQHSFAQLILESGNIAYLALILNTLMLLQVHDLYSHTTRVSTGDK